MSTNPENTPFILIRFIQLRMSIVSSAMVAFGFAMTMELSQLHHAPWIEAAGELHPDYHANLGTCADGRCLNFLRVEDDLLKKRVSEGGTDEEILEWCYANGRRLNENDLFVWNGFITKLGWNDLASGRLQEVQAANGLADRDDIQTMAQFFDVDEGRKT